MSSTQPPIVIALDGPAASGKGTLARSIAAHYDFAHLDTGILYRGVAWIMLNDREDPEDAARAVRAAKEFSLEKIRGAAIRTPQVSAASSIVAANPGVREALLQFQRRFAETPPGEKKGAVLDGRDIGTKVCPDATVKFYVTASPEIRAQRRHEEMIAAGRETTLADVLADLKVRDERDANRDDAPMVQSEDAELLDTTSLSIEGAFAAARRVIDDVFRRRAL
ncbi:MAG: (d)CMP kinase [Pseudomonadota bacterium]